MGVACRVGVTFWEGGAWTGETLDFERHLRVDSRQVGGAEIGSDQCPCLIDRRWAIIWLRKHEVGGTEAESGWDLALIDRKLAWLH